MWLGIAPNMGIQVAVIVPLLWENIMACLQANCVLSAMLKLTTVIDVIWNGEVLKTLIANFASRLKPTTSAPRLHSNVNLNGCNNPFMCILQIHAKQRSQTLPRGFHFLKQLCPIDMFMALLVLSINCEEDKWHYRVNMYRCIIFCLHALTISEIPTTTSFV